MWSESCNGTYCINLGEPCCQCEDWNQTHLPCKHMLLVFSCHPDSWEFVPKDYRSSPFFALDMLLCGKTEISNEEQDNSYASPLKPIPTPDEANSEAINTADMKSKKVREITEEIRTLSYLLPSSFSHEGYQAVTDYLSEVKNILMNSIPQTQEGFISLPVHKRKKKEKKEKSKKKVKFLPLHANSKKSRHYHLLHKRKQCL